MSNNMEIDFMDTIKILIILSCVLAIWVLSFYLRQWIGKKSNHISVRLKYRARHNAPIKYHNRHLTDGDTPSLWEGGSNDPGICRKVKRKKRKGAYEE